MLCASSSIMMSLWISVAIVKATITVRLVSSEEFRKSTYSLLNDVNVAVDIK